MTDNTQAEALAALIERFRGLHIDHEPDGWPAVRTREITALLDRIAELEAQLEAIGAGGVSGPLVGQPQAMPDLSALTERGAKAWAGVDAAQWFTVVYHGISTADEARSLGEHPKAAAISWSHAIRERDAARAAHQEPVAPHGWLYDWTHSSATGRPDETYTGFTKDEQHARKHDNCTPVYTAQQPALSAQAISAEPERTPPTWLTDPAPTRERLFSEWLNSKRDYNVSEVFHGIMQKFASLSAAEPAGVALPSHGHQRAIMEAARNAGLGAYRRVVFLTNGETRIYEHAFTNGWNRRASSGLAPVQQADPSITLDFKQATELLEMFGGEAGLVTLQHGGAKCHSGPGLYAWYSDLPEEGAEFLGAEPDNEAAPSATAT